MQRRNEMAALLARRERDGVTFALCPRRRDSVRDAVVVELAVASGVSRALTRRAVRRTGRCARDPRRGRRPRCRRRDRDIGRHAYQRAARPGERASAMLSLPASIRIFVARDAVDFRKAHDGLLAVVRDAFGDHSFDGSLFVFLNRDRTA